MTKQRAVSAVLWFLVGWYAGALIASFLGVPPALGPILGTAAAAIIAGDPRRRIWGSSTAGGRESLDTLMLPRHR